MGEEKKGARSSGVFCEEGREAWIYVRYLPKLGFARAYP